ncbi:MAG: class I SAM-dependent methyltransferase [Spirulinaceae cyanobacterium SM2_1_0]|nr:class I SAM-dependent methyltransferase [Spirulinaceae cyanobacterium SM2_1_0]
MTAASNAERLTQILSDRLAASPEKRLTFAEFMAIALYHPEFGYYSSGQVGIGASGDFFTASSLGADFGELLALQCAEIYAKLAQPQPFYLVEMGAGLGTLAADILQTLSRNHPQVFAATRYIIVEAAPALRDRQQEHLAPWAGKVFWQDWDAIADDAWIGCCFANELVDALPVHRVVKQEGELQELYVTAAAGQWREVAGELSTAAIADYCQLNDLDFSQPEYPEGYSTEINLAAGDWLQQVARKLQRGYLITIDYGYAATRYYNPQRAQGTLQCYYQHRRHTDPYINLGQQDITAHVNFTALQRWGDRLRLPTVGFTQQGLFLMALGLGDRLAALSSGRFDLATIFRRRDALHQLIDPAGLGNFGVLVQAKGMPAEELLQGLREPGR